MFKGIAGKLSATYLLIIFSTIIMGVSCLYAITRYQNSIKDMRYVTLPSLDKLKEIENLSDEISRLANSLVFAPDKINIERLSYITKNAYATDIAFLDSSFVFWTDAREKELYKKTRMNVGATMDSSAEFLRLIHSANAYTDDSVMDRVTDLNAFLFVNTESGHKGLKSLISTKSNNLERLQIAIFKLQDYVFALFVFTIILILMIGVMSLRYTVRSVIRPLLNLNNIIMEVAAGDIVAVEATNRTDEIGEMQNAVVKMLEGINQKIEFAEQIGRGNYTEKFTLLSNKDKLGKALLIMRSDFVKSTDKLKRQEKMLIDAQRLAKVGNFNVNLKTGKFESSVTLDEILGLNEGFKKSFDSMRNLVAEDFLQSMIEKRKKALEQREVFHEEMIMKRNDDGQERWIEMIGEHIYDTEGKATSFFGTLRDITASKLLELELNRSFELATKQNKMLLNFSHITSHNLRMHAVNISSLLGMIKEAESTEESEEYMKMLETASENLNETMLHLNDVVAVQGDSDIEKKMLPLRERIGHAVGVLQSQIKSRNAVIHNNIDKDIMVNYNAAYLDSMILNFLSNAIKYARPNVQPVVDLDCYKENPRQKSSRWILKFSDNGVGIDLTRHGSKLFGMYKTFHGNKDAKGIGLFLTKYQIEAMGGAVEVESEIGIGTTFKVYIV